MNAVQFGRWLADRRRAYGYRSQRVLVAKIQAQPLPWELSAGISEDFLARLEAGQLAHPFRGSVRQRVLALAWQLCKTPRDIKAYLNVAELTQLDAQELEYIQLLQERLVPHPALAGLPLPPPPHAANNSAIRAKAGKSFVIIFLLRRMLIPFPVFMSYRKHHVSTAFFRVSCHKRM